MMTDETLMKAASELARMLYREQSPNGDRKAAIWQVQGYTSALNTVWGLEIASQVVNTAEEILEEMKKK